MGDEDSPSLSRCKERRNKNTLFQVTQPPVITTVPAEPSEFLTRLPILTWTASLHFRHDDLIGCMMWNQKLDGGDI